MPDGLTLIADTLGGRIRCLGMEQVCTVAGAGNPSGHLDGAALSSIFRLLCVCCLMVACLWRTPERS
jgi:hypothetical protein